MKGIVRRPQRAAFRGGEEAESAGPPRRGQLRESARPKDTALRSAHGLSTSAVEPQTRPEGCPQSRVLSRAGQSQGAGGGKARRVPTAPAYKTRDRANRSTNKKTRL